MANVNAREVFEAYNAALVNAVQSNGEWLKFIEASATIGPASTRRFSFMNQVWLALQGSSGHTATFKGWRRLGRTVVKGAKAVSVLKPIVVPKKDAAGNIIKAADGSPVTMLVGFTTLNQFKVEDTADLKTGERGFTPPPPPVDVSASFEGWQHLIPALERDFKVRIGFDSESMPEGANGFFRYSDRQIVVRVGERSSGAVFRTLCHELAHSYLHGEASHDDRSVRELEAESTAAVVCRALGLATDTYSFNYVAVWAGEKPEGLEKLVKASGQNITRAADAILNIVAPVMDGGDDE
jgi:hypothetical protein